MSDINNTSNITISVSDFINTKYREYWEYSNSNGKNSIDAREQLPEVIRKIIYAAYLLNIKPYDEHKTTELMGEVGKYHAHGPSSIEDSIKGVATAYKSQPAVRILEGIGNFGSAPGDEGAAGRYTSVSGTPLLSRIYQDIPYLPMNTDDTGLSQPDYISAPLPFALINGHSPIGTGKSCYVGERDAKEVIAWIDELRKFDFDEEKVANNAISSPSPMCVTGCKTWYESSNGYIYYEAIIHNGVDRDNIDKRGRYDVITALPPKQSAGVVIPKLINKLPTRASKQVIDGSGKGRPTYIILPTGYLDEKDYMKYGLRSARKENIFVWDNEESTMKSGTIVDLAKGWFEDRCRIVKLRLEDQIENSKAKVHRIDLIKEFSKKKMIDWKADDVIKYFVDLAENTESGEADASLVLGLPARSFLPENLDKNEILREKELAFQEEMNDKLIHIGNVVINEAYEVIEEQEKFFKA